MNLLKKLAEYAKTHECELKGVVNGLPTETVIKNIDKDIKKINKLGGTKKVTRIVVANEQLVYLQSEDNGDKVVWIISPEYLLTKSLIKKIEGYCKENELLFSNI